MPTTNKTKAKTAVANAQAAIKNTKAKGKTTMPNKTTTKAQPKAQPKLTVKTLNAIVADKLPQSSKVQANYAILAQCLVAYTQIANLSVKAQKNAVNTVQVNLPNGKGTTDLTIVKCVTAQPISGTCAQYNTQYSGAAKNWLLISTQSMRTLQIALNINVPKSPTYKAAHMVHSSINYCPINGLSSTLFKHFTKALNPQGQLAQGITMPKVNNGSGQLIGLTGAALIDKANPLLVGSKGQNTYLAVALPDA